jgi:hypothetical protein
MTEYRYEVDYFDFDPMSRKDLEELSKFLNTMSMESGWEVFRYQALPYPGNRARRIAHILFRRTYEREWQEAGDKRIYEQSREIMGLKEQLAKYQQKENAMIAAGVTQSVASPPQATRSSRPSTKTALITDAVIVGSAQRIRDK